MPKTKGLVERLHDGESVLCAEGYLREMERRGYACLGINTPDAVLRHPERVKSLYEEFALAGSDVIVAYTYYAHRPKLSKVGQADRVEDINRSALRLAREVADQTNTLMAGDICNSTIYDPDDPMTHDQVKDMFEEQVTWAVEEGADYVIGESFHDYGEAKLALEAIQKYGQGVPAVITMAVYCPEVTTDGLPYTQALQLLEQDGAAVVGLNCGRGPRSMLPLIRKARPLLKGPLAALPVMFRTSEKDPSFFSLRDYETDQLIPLQDRESRMCSRSDARQFAREAREIGVQYIGLCCGSNPTLFREVAEEYGRTPPSSANRPDISYTTMYQSNPSARTAKLRKFMLCGDV